MWHVEKCLIWLKMNAFAQCNQIKQVKKPSQTTIKIANFVTHVYEV
jgi:hypothetical protein